MPGYACYDDVFNALLYWNNKDDIIPSFLLEERRLEDDLGEIASVHASGAPPLRWSAAQQTRRTRRRLLEMLFLPSSSAMQVC